MERVIPQNRLIPLANTWLRLVLDAYLLPANVVTKTDNRRHRGAAVQRANVVIDTRGYPTG